MLLYLYVLYQKEFVLYIMGGISVEKMITAFALHDGGSGHRAFGFRCIKYTRRSLGKLDSRKASNFDVFQHPVFSLRYCILVILPLR